VILEVQRKGISVRRSLLDAISKQIDEALSRFAGRIRRVSICLSDTNGPRGGVDKDCSIAVQLVRGKTLRARQSDANLLAATNLAADRVTHALRRELERRRKKTGRRRPWESNAEPAEEAGT
jgi:ribosome-associated translation inhibitor RaiA